MTCGQIQTAEHAFVIVCNDALTLFGFLVICRFIWWVWTMAWTQRHGAP